MAIKVPYPNMQGIIEKSGIDAVDVKEFISQVKRSMQPHKKLISVSEDGVQQTYEVVLQGLGPIVTPFGNFWQYNFTINDEWEKYSVIVKGELDLETFNPVFHHSGGLVVRMDSGCETGQMFHDQTCDCREQLHLAMQTIEQVGAGLIVNIPRQDGRGMGLPFKLATLWLQQRLNVHTVESAGLIASDGVIDVRTYSGVIGVLKFFGVPEHQLINLATNNPDKIKVFKENGYVVDTMPVVIEPTEHTEHHLQAKKTHFHHTNIGVNKTTESKNGLIND
jgi:GTP cyclohydrolase II